jgi:hypothetical protein
VTSNNTYGNAYGIFGDFFPSNNILAADNIYSNTYGFYCGGTFGGCSNNLFISNNIYSNGIGYYSSAGATNNACVNCNIGYSSSSVSLPETTAEIAYAGDSTANNLTLKNSNVNPFRGIQTSGINTPVPFASYLLNYSTNPGVVQVYGDYLVAGSTFTLDYSTNSYGSTATTPKLMQGTGHSATVNGTSDANAISQLITITYRSADTLWHVTASSGPAGDLCTFAAGGGGPTNCPSSNTQFSLTVSPGGTRNDGDKLDFALTAYSNDFNQPKKLQFAAITGSGMNNNRSKIEIASGAGFVLKLQLHVYAGFRRHVLHLRRFRGLYDRQLQHQQYR